MSNPVWDQWNVPWGDDAFPWGTGLPPVTPDPDDSIVPLDILSTPTLEQMTLYTAEHLPNGLAWSSKLVDGTNLNALIKSCAAAFLRIQQQITTLATEFDINLTSELLPDWEASVGLPDECQRQITDLETRRQNVISRLNKMPVVTKAQFETLGSSLAQTTVVVNAGADVDVPVVAESYFRMYVSLPELNPGFAYDFAFAFGGARSELLECVFKKIVPANVILIFS